MVATLLHVSAPSSESLLDAVVTAIFVVALATVAVLYTRGWLHLHTIGHAPRSWRVMAYALGLATLAVALLALDRLAEDRFSVHMIQHLLLMMAAAPLLMLGNPLSVLLWGLPRHARRALAAATLQRGARFRSMLAALVSLPTGGVIHVVTVWVWHSPLLYDAAAEHELVHIVEHAMFLGTAVLFWWPILQPAPRLTSRPHAALQIVYFLAATAQNTALGMVLTIPERPFYPHYVARAAALGIDPVSDQAFGGGLMWMMGHMYLLPILLILYTLSRASQPPRGGRESAANVT
jgi:putative membrane protein